jgi:hypothetical protein
MSNKRNLTEPADLDESRSKRLRQAPILLLAAAFMVLGARLLARAQETGPEPGAKDPVGQPASYIILRSDDLMVGKYGSGDVNQLNTYTVDNQGRPSSPLDTAKGQGVLGLGNSLSASGRILTQTNDQIVNAGRSADGQSLELRFSHGGVYELPGLLPAIKNVPDLVSLAMGDLDQIPDAEGVNHDEVVVAYATGSGSSAAYKINLEVLNYTNPNSDGSHPLFVTRAIPDYESLIENNSSYTVSDLLSVAIGDFDGKGQNEIAVASLYPKIPQSSFTEIVLSIFRYHHKLLTDTPTLEEVTRTRLPIHLPNPDLLPTISLVAGNFTGALNNSAQLVLCLQNGVTSTGSRLIQNVLQEISIDSNLKPTLKGLLLQTAYSVSTTQGPITASKVVGLAGLFRYDPPGGFDLYRRELARVYNEAQPVGSDSSAKLDIDAYYFTSDFMGSGALFAKPLQLANAGVGAKFDATAGGLTVGGNLKTPLWTLATAQLTSGSLEDTLTTIRLGSNLTVDSSTKIPSSCCGGGTLATDNAFRPTVQAYDYRGRTFLFGAPTRLTFNDLVNTDFVLQEPPKDAYWDEAAKQVVNVSRVAATAVGLTNTQGSTFSAKSTDTSALASGDRLRSARN